MEAVAAMRFIEQIVENQEIEQMAGFFVLSKEGSKLYCEEMIELSVKDS